jgi:ABC-type sugar transport system permease subunit
LQGIPASLYESAKVDGANEWEVFWKITLPMVAPMMQLVIVYTILDSFTHFNNPVLGYIREQTFSEARRFEYGAAIGWIYFLFIIVFISVGMGVMNVYMKKAERPEVKRRAIYQRLQTRARA